MRWLLVLVALFGCSDKPNERKKTEVKLAAGPVPVNLVIVDTKSLNTLATAKDFVVVDVRGILRFGHVVDSPTPFAGDLVERKRNTAGNIFVGGDGDTFAVLARDTSAFAIVLADGGAPASATVRDGIDVHGTRPSFLAANAGNTVVPYRFGAEPWEDDDATRVNPNRLDELPATLTDGVIVEFESSTITASLVTALVALADRGVKRVRLHRMMGWGGIPRRSVKLKGAAADDDVFSDDRSTVTNGEPRIEGTTTTHAILTFVNSVNTRFRYCFEMKEPPANAGTIELAFDVDTSGVATNVSAKGIDDAIASCIAGSIDRGDVLVPRDDVKTSGHVVVPLVFTRESTPKPVEPSKEGTGWWCWSGRDSIGPIGTCTRDEIECVADIDHYNEMMQKLENPEMNAICKQQKIAYEHSQTKPLPTQALCKATPPKGEKCRAIK